MPLRRDAVGVLCLPFIVSACAGFAAPTINPIREDVASRAARLDFMADTIAIGEFKLFSLLRKSAASSVLVVYIEGDGAGWPSPFSPPRDPTPPTSTALQLSVGDASPAVAYLGRPCQYLSDSERAHCPSRYWSDQRYSREVLAAMNEAIDHLKQRSDARWLRLVGYSGGGVVAALVATEREDVAELITVASPLALSAWTAMRNLTPFDDASDPYQRKRSPIFGSATHFAGTRDAVVPPSIVKRFVDAQGGRLVTMEGYDHQCCWVEAWPMLLQRVESTGASQ